MKRILIILFVLLMAVAVISSCTPNNQIDSTPNTENDIIDTDSSVDTDTSLPSDMDSDIIDTGSDNLESDIPNDTDSNTDTDSDITADSEINTDSDANTDDNTDDSKDEEPEIIDISVSKTADEMAESIGKYNNGDIVSGSQIKLDDNIYVSFGKGFCTYSCSLSTGLINLIAPFYDFCQNSNFILHDSCKS